MKTLKFMSIVLALSFCSIGLSGVENAENPKKRKRVENEASAASKRVKLSLKNYTAQELVEALYSKDEESLQSIKDFIINNPEILKEKVKLFRRGSDFIESKLGYARWLLYPITFFIGIEADIDLELSLLVNSWISFLVKINILTNLKKESLSDAENEIIAQELNKVLDFMQFLFNYSCVGNSMIKANVDLPILMRWPIKAFNRYIFEPINGLSTMLDLGLDMKLDKYPYVCVAVVVLYFSNINAALKNDFVVSLKDNVVKNMLTHLFVFSDCLQTLEPMKIYNAQDWQEGRGYLNTLATNTACLNIFDEIEHFVKNVNEVEVALLENSIDLYRLSEIDTSVLGIAIKRLVFSQSIELDKLMNILFSSEEENYEKLKLYFDNSKDDFGNLLEVLRKFKHGLGNPEIAKAILLGYADSDYVLNSIEWNAYTLVRARKLAKFGMYFRSWAYNTLLFSKKVSSEIGSVIGSYSDTSNALLKDNLEDNAVCGGPESRLSYLNNISRYIPSLSSLNPFYLAKFKFNISS